MPVPFLDLKAQYAPLRESILEAMGKVLDNTAYILGPAVADFEKKFAPYCGAAFAAGVNTGTSALHAALLALGVGPGDEVIVPAMTFIATASAVDYTGAKTVLVDVDPASYTMDPALIEAAITPRTKVIMPVHLYGQPADMDPILAIAAKHGLKVVEDAAQAHGAEYKGRRCGSMGALAGFSFYPGKNLGAYGEGGAVVTSDPEADRVVRILRDWGQDRRYHHVMKGFNFRMDGLQGAVLGVKLAHLEAWTEGRRRAAAMYAEALAGIPDLTLPRARADVRHVWHIYAVRVPERDRVLKHLNDRGIGAAIHYPVPVHLQPCFSGWGYRAGQFPVAEQVGSTELSLPMFPELTRAQVDEVASVLREAMIKA
ncbi:MAG: DegT/DnrJ/EryC1/StrS family aminotransferase [Kiritimatiellia bacterium]